MAITAVINQDITEPSGRRRVWYEFVDDATGNRYPHGIALIPENADAQAHVNGKLPKFEREIRAEEARLFFRNVEDAGGDGAVVPLLYHTVGALRRMMVRRFFNQAKRAQQGDSTATIRLRTSRGFITSLPMPVLVNATGWTSARVNAALAKIDAYILALNALDHNEGELSEDDI